MSLVHTLLEPELDEFKGARLCQFSNELSARVPSLSAWKTPHSHDLITRYRKVIIIDNSQRITYQRRFFRVSKYVMQHLHMRQYVARHEQECKSELIVGAGLECVRVDGMIYYQFWWLVLLNQGRPQGKNGAWDTFWKQAMSRQRKHGWAAYSRHEDAVDEKDFEVAIGVFPQWCRYSYRRGGPEWSWRCVSWKNFRKVQRLLLVKYLESSCGNFEIDSTVNRESVQVSQNWRDVAVPRLWCNNSSKGVLNHLKANKIRCGCASKKENYNSRAESRLLPRPSFLLPQWSVMNECGTELECGNTICYKSGKHAYRKTCESLGEHLDLL